MAAPMRYLSTKYFQLSKFLQEFNSINCRRMLSGHARGLQISSKSFISSQAAALLRLTSPTNVSFLNRRSVSGYSQAVGTEDDKLYKTIDIEVKGHDTAVLNSYEKFVTMAARELGINMASVTAPRRIIERYTLLKSAHVHRKHMVQYEARTMFRCFQVKHVTGSTADTFLEYIQRNLPEGMAMKVSRCAIEAIPDHLKPPTVPTSTSESSSNVASPPHKMSRKTKTTDSIAQ